MPDDDIDSYWEGIRPRREPSRSPPARVERPRATPTPFEETIQFIPAPHLVTPPIQQAGRPPHGIIDRHNPDAGLSTIRSLRQSLQAHALEGPSESQARGAYGATGFSGATGVNVDPDDTWSEFEPLSTREQRIRNHAYMDGLSNREEPNGNSPLNRLMTSLAALGITGSVGQERLSNGNRAVWLLIEPVPNEVPHFRIGTRVTSHGGLEITVEFPEER